MDDLQGVMFAVPLAQAGNLERAEAELERAEAAVELVGLDFARALAAYGAGLITEKLGDCRKAAESYGQALSLYPGFVDGSVARGRCQRELGELEAAEVSLLSVLKVIPAHAKARLELALVYADMGRTADAIEQLETTLEIWKDADSDYRPAQRAQETLAELLEGAL